MLLQTLIRVGEKICNISDNRRLYYCAGISSERLKKRKSAISCHDLIFLIMHFIYAWSIVARRGHFTCFGAQDNSVKSGTPKLRLCRLCNPRGFCHIPVRLVDADHPTRNLRQRSCLKTLIEYSRMLASLIWSRSNSSSASRKMGFIELDKASLDKRQPEIRLRSEA